MADPLERLTNLVALLLETREPRTLHDITYALVGQYPETEAGRRAAFERDKSVLRQVGIPLEQTVLSGDQAGQTGYWIERSQYELSDLGLTDDERQALQVAVATVHLGAGWADDAMMKLGGNSEAGPGLWASTLSTSDQLPSLYQAVTERRAATFTYHHQRRQLEPWGLLARNGFWYVVGHDRGAGERRTYRVDRIEGAVDLGVEGAFIPPADVHPGATFDEGIRRLGESDGPSEALVVVDAGRARAVVDDLGEAAVAEHRPDGSVVVRVPCTNRLVFRAWVLGFVEHAEVLGPPAVRAEIVDWLEAMVRRG